MDELKEQNEETEAEQAMQKAREAEEYFKRAKEKAEQKKAELANPIKEEKVLVVNELPMQKYNILPGENGAVYHLITRDEAFTEILSIVRQLKKSICG
jgi:hypothetical protein